MSSIFCFYDQIPLGSPKKKRLYATQGLLQNTPMKKTTSTIPKGLG